MSNRRPVPSEPQIDNAACRRRAPSYCPRPMTGTRMTMLAGLLLVWSCQQCGPPRPSTPDAGDVDGGTGEGGGQGGGGGRTGTSVDGGPRLVGCEVNASTGGTPPECAPSEGACTKSDDCPSKLCLKLGTGGVCTEPCTTQPDCEPGWTCQQRWTSNGPEGFCVPERRTP
jgi:hypothetical protein